MKYPLLGKTILVTRSRKQASQFSKRLRDRGAKVIEFPTIKIVPLKNYRRLDAAIQKIHHYDWLIFTSVNGVDYFFRRFKKGNFSFLPKTAAIGSATKEKLKKWGVKSDLLADEFRAEGILKKFSRNLTGEKILIPRAEKTREILPEELRKRGAAVKTIPVYRTIPAKAGASRIQKFLRERKIDLITFTSSSTVENFIAVIGKRFIPYLKGIKIASIGPITTATARKLGLKVAIQAKQYTIGGLIEALRHDRHY